MVDNIFVFVLPRILTWTVYWTLFLAPVWLNEILIFMALECGKMPMILLPMQIETFKIKYST